MCYAVKSLLRKKGERNPGWMTFTKEQGKQKTRAYALVYTKAKVAMCRLLHASIKRKRAPVH